MVSWRNASKDTFSQYVAFRAATMPSLEERNLSDQDFEHPWVVAKVLLPVTSVAREVFGESSIPMGPSLRQEAAQVDMLQQLNAGHAFCPNMGVARLPKARARLAPRRALRGLASAAGHKASPSASPSLPLGAAAASPPPFAGRRTESVRHPKLSVTRP